MSLSTRNDEGPTAHGDNVPIAGNVVPLHPSPPSALAWAAPRREPPAALQDAPRFAALRETDHVELGYRHGLLGSDHENLRHGCARIIVHGCSVFEHMVQARVALLDEAAHGLLDAGQEGSPLVRDHLQARAETWRRDIETLERQRELGRKGEGWLEPMLVDYRSGFHRAQREVLDMQRWSR